MARDAAEEALGARLGDGYSAIAVEDGILYTGYRKDANDVVVALEAATGKTAVGIRLRRAVQECVFGTASVPGPYAMPQVVGDRVVTASGIGLIHSIEKKTGTAGLVVGSL